MSASSTSADQILKSASNPGTRHTPIWTRPAGKIVLALAATFGAILLPRPAAADCTFDPTVGAYVCEGTSNTGIPTTPLLDNGKIQVNGGAQIVSPGTALRVGSNNTIDSTGLVSGRDAGINSTGNLTFNNTGEVLGRGAAVFVTAGDLEMTNTNSASAANTAINVSGNVKLTNSGTISGRGGVSASSATVFNSGKIQGQYYAIKASGDVTVTNDGTLEGGAPGGNTIEAGVKANVVNNGRINGSIAAGRAMTVTNVGEISGNDIVPVFNVGTPAAPVAGTKFALDSSGVISGSGILAAVTGSSITITNSGTITNNASAGGMPVAFSATGATLAITNTGNIIGNSTGAIADANDLVLNNRNRIIANSIGFGFRGATMTVNNGGVIESRGAGLAIFTSTGDLTFTNSGALTGLASTTAIASGGNATILNTGLISTGASASIAVPTFAIAVQGKALITNDGEITSAATAMSVGDQSEIANGGKITVTGASLGAVLGTASASLANTGQIEVSGAGAFAMRTAQNLQATNSGRITVTGLNAMGFASLGAATINNNGKLDVQGTGSTAIASTGDMTLVNNGEIASGGIAVTTGGRLDLTNNGQITGTTGIVVAPGSGPAKIVNQGYIFGSGGVAISLTNAADELTLGSKSRIQGLINLGGGGDTVNVTLAPGRSRIIVFDDLTNATVNVTGTPSWQIVGNALVSLDTTSLLMRHATISDVRNGIGDILESRVNQRMFENDPERSFYVKAFGGGGTYSANKGAAAFATRHAGLVAGVEAVLAPNAVVGGFAGGAWGNASASGTLSDSTNATLMLAGLYGRLTHGMIVADANIVAGYASTTTNMSILSNIAPGGLEKLKSNDSGLFLSPKIGVGVKVPLNPETSVTPGVRYRYTSASWNNSTRVSASGLGLSSGPSSSSEIRGQVQVSQEARLPGALFRMHFTTGYLFESVSTGNYRVTYNGASLASSTSSNTRNSGVFASTGVEWRDQAGMSYFANLQGDWRSNKSVRFGGRGGVKFSF